VFCATDFPHEDDEEGTTEYVNQWRTMEGQSDTDRRNILSETARRAYSLPALAKT
jgi:predicted TIM-barrel fold metal-dependent hydrolase